MRLPPKSKSRPAAERSKGAIRRTPRPEALETWRLTIEYDGTKYSGWQEQLNARTVMGQLRRAAAELFQSSVELQGAGRTDAGVHALGQVAHLRAAPNEQLSAEQIRRGLNDRLPSDVCVLEVEKAPASFHARHDATSRTYLYQISTRRSAFLKKYVWWVKEKLNVEEMARAAQMLVGRHDFRAFRAEDPSRPDESTIVVVESATVELEGDLILFRIRASHYLWRMVRRIVGVLVKIGMGELKADALLPLLKGKAGAESPIATWTAPASGLFLENIEYDSRVRSSSRRPR